MHTDSRAGSTESDSLAEVLAADRAAVLRSAEIVDLVDASHLGLPTPCAAWTLGDLLAHMIAQHHGFAAAATGSGADLAAWQIEPVGLDPAGAYRASIDLVLTSFARADLARGFDLPEIRDGGPFPAATAVSFHLVDYVVHSWDVAASIGVRRRHAAGARRGRAEGGGSRTRRRGA